MQKQNIMINIRRAAHLSIFITFALLLLSLSVGYRNYTLVGQAVVSDLNQALQQTIIRNPQLLSRDTIQAYTHLLKTTGSPLSIESYNRTFATSLRHKEIREKSRLVVQVRNRYATARMQPYINKDESSHILSSDTVIWLSAANITPSMPEANLGISFQGRTECTPQLILAMMDKRIPALFFFLAVISGCLCFYLRSRKEVTTDADTRVSFGDLSFSPDEAFFYKTDGDKLKLTPLQYNVMEMFFASPKHILQRADICHALWPGKDNADETLNTLMRRLRPLIEENSNLKITTDRGRAYILEITGS